MKFNILLKGYKIHENLTHEECSDILMNLSERYYDKYDFEAEDLEVEPILEESD
jgi:hypothetical protein